MDHLTKIGPDSSVFAEVDSSQYTEVIPPMRGLYDGGIRILYHT